MPQIMISIANDFSKYPGGRWKKDGPHSGQQFREDLLAPALEQVAEASDSFVVVSLDGVAGYGSSFLEESFGGIVRANILPPEVLSKKLQIRSADPIYAGFLQDAIRCFRDAISRATAHAAA